MSDDAIQQRQSDPVSIERTVRDRVLADPDVILEDVELMRALVAANEAAMGENVVDLRGAAMAKLETRIDALEDTHRSVVAAAYDNVAGTRQVHRAVLQMLEAPDFAGFIRMLDGEVADILRVDGVRVLMEGLATGDGAAATGRLGAALGVVEAGFVGEYLGNGASRPQRRVRLRAVPAGADGIFVGAAGPIRSEALIQLDLGEGRLAGMLVFGSCDPEHFRPGEGTDLLEFLGGVVERAMRRWLE